MYLLNCPVGWVLDKVLELDDLRRLGGLVGEDGQVGGAGQRLVGGHRASPAGSKGHIEAELGVIEGLHAPNRLQKGRGTHTQKTL